MNPCIYAVLTSPVLVNLFLSSQDFSRSLLVHCLGAVDMETTNNKSIKFLTFISCDYCDRTSHVRVHCYCEFQCNTKKN